MGARLVSEGAFTSSIAGLDSPALHYFSYYTLSGLDFFSNVFLIQSESRIFSAFAAASIEVFSSGSKRKVTIVSRDWGVVMAAKKKNWIQAAIKKPGALRKALGAKSGKSIPAAKLARAAKAKGKLGQRARLAQTLKKLRRG